MKDKGLGDKIKGKAKEVTGEVTGNRKMEAEGVADQKVGKMKEAAHDTKEKIERKAEELEIERGKRYDN